MAEGDIIITNRFKKGRLDDEISMKTDTFKIILLKPGFTPDIDTHDTYSDISASEYSTGSGYTAGGQALTGVSTARDNANDRATIDFNDPVWESLGPLDPQIPSYAAIYDDTHASDIVVGFIELGVRAPNGANFGLTVNAAGLLALA